MNRRAARLLRALPSSLFCALAASLAGPAGAQPGPPPGPAAAPTDTIFLVLQPGPPARLDSALAAARAEEQEARRAGDRARLEFEQGQAEMALRSQDLAQIVSRFEEAKRAQAGPEMVALDWRRKRQEAELAVLQRMQQVRQRRVDLALAAAAAAQATAAAVQLEKELGEAGRAPAATTFEITQRLTQVRQLEPRALEARIEESARRQALAAQRVEVDSSLRDLFRARERLAAIPPPK